MFVVGTIGPVLCKTKHKFFFEVRVFGAEFTHNYIWLLESALHGKSAFFKQEHRDYWPQIGKILIDHFDKAFVVGNILGFHWDAEIFFPGPSILTEKSISVNPELVRITIDSVFMIL
jgi:hypothetical protein